MIIPRHRHTLRVVVSVFTRAVTNMQSEPGIHSVPQTETQLRLSLCAYLYTSARLFSSESDSQGQDSFDIGKKEKLDIEKRNEDDSDEHSPVSSQSCVSNLTSSLPDEEKHLEPALAAMMDEKTQPPSALKTISVVPGKGPPPEPPVTCCMSGCVNCVWIKYAEELKDYYSDGGEQAKAAVEKIEDASLRAFVKLELGL
ncbi:unnamed protein product [Candidula unifasciata]|uniref:Oxidoreductase-like domain-containing protein n=1 Tax=Candidula unifasciata TaxID=100452 RepID=A0A8S3YJX5_9EUPU|nr:unnamed protein product [Candidula unifasciata]